MVKKKATNQEGFSPLKERAEREKNSHHYPKENERAVIRDLKKKKGMGYKSRTGESPSFLGGASSTSIEKTNGTLQRA